MLPQDKMLKKEDFSSDNISRHGSLVIHTNNPETEILIVQSVLITGAKAHCNKSSI